MPLEFSIAAFRFGHTMVRGAYDFNRNFGVGAEVLADRRLQPAVHVHRRWRNPFNGETDVLPFNWVIEWDRLRTTRRRTRGTSPGRSTPGSPAPSTT